MNTNDKSFIGIVTCNRPNFFELCYKYASKCSNIDFIGVVNDGQQEIVIPQSNIPTEYIKNSSNIGVGRSKNELFRMALSKPDIRHIFIVEDDIIVKDQKVLDLYIKASKITGIEHFMFGYHGPANRNGLSKGAPSPKYVIDYGTIKLAINMHSVGAFCYYSRNVLEKVGLIDEEYLNAFEHVDHDYRIAKAGYTTPYWNWPDLADSYEYIDEIECSERSSSIRPRNDWMDNIKKGAQLFYKKHGMMPAWQGCVPDITKQQLIKVLKDIKIKND